MTLPPHPRDVHGPDLSVPCAGTEMFKNASLLSLESIGLLATSLVLMLLSAGGIGFSPSHGLAGPQFSFEPGFLFEYGLVALALAIFSVVLRLSGTSLAKQLRQLCAARVRVDFRQPWVAAAIALLLIVAMPLMGQPMRYDEAFTQIFFIDRSWTNLFYYPLPNNHVLFTVIAALFDAAFGPRATRWPALLFGLAAVPVTFHACRKLAGPNAGYLGAMGMALCPFVIAFATLARGYSLLVLAVVAMIVVIADDDRFPWQAKPAALALLAAASLATMPSALYALAGIATWAACAHLGVFRSMKAMVIALAVPFAALSLLFTALLYIPVLLVNRFELIANSRFFAPLPWKEFVPEIGPHLVEAGIDLSRGVPVLVLGILLALVIAATVRGSWRLATLLPAMLAGSAAVLLLKQSIPFARTWIYLIPVALVAADAGFALLLNRAGDARKIALPVLLALATVGAWSLAGSYLLRSGTDGGASPDARGMAATVSRTLAPNDWLCSSVPHDVLLRYYLQADHPGPRVFSPGDQVFYVVDGQFTGNRFVRAGDVSLRARAGTLSLYRLSSATPIEHAGKSFHCWLRGGVFLG